MLSLALEPPVEVGLVPVPVPVPVVDPEPLPPVELPVERVAESTEVVGSTEMFASPVWTVIYVA